MLIKIFKHTTDFNGRLKLDLLWNAAIGIQHSNAGGGLHGLRPGDNDPGVWYDNGHYIALKVDPDSIIALNGKCKFPRAEILFVADNMIQLSLWLQMNGYNGPWYRGTASAGYGGTATAGNYGTAAAGEYGTVTAGICGTLQIKWYDKSRMRISTAYVGENGILPNTPYVLDQNRTFVEKRA